MAKKEMTTYLIVHEDKTERQIEVPSDWKVTFGPASKGSNKVGGQNFRMPLALRFYENETRQRAIFTDVVSFRDLSIKTKMKKVAIQQKEGFMEYGGQRKATTFQTTVEEWIDPDQSTDVPALSAETSVEDFDVDFRDIA